ncbi:hypothetical protein [Geothrix sp. PMB-07]|uniref:hypothetical protein n=1 Tax=Geothrix sp. PMB-07 TaxID=3068640 RepID=UPI002741ACA3|nr:hypothetical protein [Geothrix sp. PMB-07]WLT32743.1 hypothetical protein Q9293_05270 [Geothrix sp. PMB-07]
MKKLLLVLILVAPLAAQNFEVGVNISQQNYTSSTAPGFAGHSDPVAFDFDSKTVVAARVGYSWFDMGPALFQVTAAYQPKTDTDLKPNGVTVPTKLGSEYWAIGAMFNFKALVAVGAGVDYRFEKTTKANIFTTTNSYSRPWARVNAGYAFPTPLIKPFIGLEVAAPFTKENDGPKLQVGIYAGVRF